jgi:hypothetical protein
MAKFGVLVHGCKVSKDFCFVRCLPSRDVLGFDLFLGVELSDMVRPWIDFGLLGACKISGSLIVDNFSLFL